MHPNENNRAKTLNSTVPQPVGCETARRLVHLVRPAPDEDVGRRQARRIGQGLAPTIENLDSDAKIGLQIGASHKETEAFSRCRR